MGIAANLKATKMTGGTREYFKEGDHRCRIESVMMGRTDVTAVDIFAVEFKIISTTSDEKSMRVGKVINWAALRQGQQAKVYFGNIKAFIGGLYGYTEDDINEMPDKELDEMLELLTGKAQAAAGMLIDVVCTPRSKDQKVFPKWQTVPEDQQTQEEEPQADGQQAASA